jgi:hypothetical protein
MEEETKSPKTLMAEVMANLSNPTKEEEAEKEPDFRKPSEMSRDKHCPKYFNLLKQELNASRTSFMSELTLKEFTVCRNTSFMARHKLSFLKYLGVSE